MSDTKDVLSRSYAYEEALMAYGYADAKVYLTVGGYALLYQNNLTEIQSAYTSHVDDAILRIMLRHIEKQNGVDD